MVRSAIFLISVFAVSCAYGPKAERKSTLSYLHGDNYQTAAGSPSDSLIVPFVKRKEKATEIQGKVMAQQGLGAVPLQGVEIGLFAEDGRLIVSGTSSAGGEFTLRAPVKNGSYKLKTIGEKYSGQYPISVQSYSVTGILFQVHKIE